MGVHVDCICCGYGSSSVSDDIDSISDDIDHHSFPSDVGLQMDTNLRLGFSDVLDDLGSSSRARICDNTELQPVLDDIEHHSLPSDVLLVDTTNRSELGLGWQDLGFSDGLDLGSSSVAHAFGDIDTDFNLFPPSKKARTS